MKFIMKVNAYFKWAKKIHQIQVLYFWDLVRQLPEMLTDCNLAYLPNLEYPIVVLLKPLRSYERVGNLFWSVGSDQ